MPRKPNYDRNELIGRARDLFWRQGWAGTSLKDLEATLQMKPGSFYAAFGSKDALFKLALERYASEGRARLRKLADEEGPLKALQRFPAMVVENSDAPAKACMLSKTLLELQAHNSPLSEDANQHLLKMESQFANLFQEAQSDGSIAATHDPKVLARRYQSDLLGLRVSAERDGIDAEAIAQEIADGLAQL
ncbi:MULTISPECIES: TetR/AcrR family transcriptional regulator [Halocynthiibacter]|uniref:TetR/AcrR family transcriptional regulator n=1 Tax=Halocynthiibacter halioticoli TaxID=2986804 RepID=A0AAE3J0S5_9RHOB|nr:MULTISPECIES: TetR/AcrR family transcriptional regulator [Halocynthiibacter]MCV6825564.1 TetR/AcrR family transcriptional regulator [Halocynthiibacter halioticoli]MCW4058565.1 TetR/AcrR family transcriptional regulator [Halocynthiibacter sp. SDUM655004]MDE0590955.1 TetR/AcrR family transcriptional regulator [Halocynthiibacter sp. C4]